MFKKKNNKNKQCNHTVAVINQLTTIIITTHTLQTFSSMKMNQMNPFYASTLIMRNK